MDSSAWVLQVQPMVFSRIKAQFSSAVKTKYNMTNANFSTVVSNNKPTVFPFVCVKMLAPMEMGETLDNTDIHGGMFTFQIDVTDNQSQQRAREVMAEVLKSMKGMRFSITQMPFYDDTADVHRMVIRCRRVIGASDIL